MHPRIPLLLIPLTLAATAAPLWAEASTSFHAINLTDSFPWLKDFVVTILGVGLLCLLIYLFRPQSIGLGAADFTIKVDGGEVAFHGRFPPGSEAAVEEFLVNDCRIEGRYAITGKWENNRLAIHVKGENAKPLEQRIRNFLKLNIKQA